MNLEKFRSFAQKDSLKSKINRQETQTGEYEKIPNVNTYNKISSKQKYANTILKINARGIQHNKYSNMSHNISTEKIYCATHMI